MAHEILSIKLSELEEQIARLIIRIQLSETADRAQLRREIGSLKQEYLENELILQKKLQLSRAEVVATIARTYEEIQPSIRHGWDALQTQVSGNDSMNEGAEKRILLAEYALDFAVQAANRALLLSMEAIATQETQLEIKEGN